MLIVKTLRWAGHVASILEVINVLTILVRRRRDHFEDWHKWEDNIKIDLKETRCEDVDSIQLVEISGSHGDGFEDGCLVGC
jgi:hypothetical protein